MMVDAGSCVEQWNKLMTCSSSQLMMQDPVFRGCRIWIGCKTCEIVLRKQKSRDVWHIQYFLGGALMLLLVVVRWNVSFRCPCSWLLVVVRWNVSFRCPCSWLLVVVRWNVSFRCPCSWLLVVVRWNVSFRCPCSWLLVVVKWNVSLVCACSWLLVVVRWNVNIKMCLFLTVGCSWVKC